MQMMMQTLPALPPAGEPVAPLAKGHGGKASGHLFAQLLGARFDSLSVPAEEASFPQALLLQAPALQAEVPLVPVNSFPALSSFPELNPEPVEGEPNPEGPAEPAQLLSLLNALQTAVQEDSPQEVAPETLVPPIPVHMQGEGVKNHKLRPEATKEAPHPSLGIRPAIEGVTAAAETPPVLDPEPLATAAIKALPAQAPLAPVVEGVSEKRPSLLERQLSSLIDPQEVPVRPDHLRSVEGFRLVPHAEAAAAPVMQGGGGASEPAAHLFSPSPTEHVPSPLTWMEEGAPAPSSTPAANHVHPAAAGGSSPLPEPAQVPAPVVHLPSGQAVPESRIVDQVVGRMALGAEGEGGSLTLKLNPKELGEVTVELVVEKDRVKAQIIAQNQQVQEVLERHLPKLRSALENQGLKLDTLQVSVDSQGDGGKGFFQEHQRPAAPVRFALRGEAGQSDEPEVTSHPAPVQGRGINVRI